MLKNAIILKQYSYFFVSRRKAFQRVSLILFYDIFYNYIYNIYINICLNFSLEWPRTAPHTLVHKEIKCNTILTSVVVYTLYMIFVNLQYIKIRMVFQKWNLLSLFNLHLELGVSKSDLSAGKMNLVFATNNKEMLFYCSPTWNCWGIPRMGFSSVQKLKILATEGWNPFQGKKFVSQGNFPYHAILNELPLEVLPLLCVHVNRFTLRP